MKNYQQKAQSNYQFRYERCNDVCLAAAAALVLLPSTVGHTRTRLMLRTELDPIRLVVDVEGALLNFLK